MKYEAVACQCTECRSMCEECPCIPTPDEARVLVRLYPQRMTIYIHDDTSVRYVAPVAKDRAAQIKNEGGGECVFYDAGLCELHALGLKSTEGRFACHDRPAHELRAVMLDVWRRSDVTDLV